MRCLIALNEWFCIKKTKVVFTLQRVPISALSFVNGLKLHICVEYNMKCIFLLCVTAPSTTQQKFKLWMQMVCVVQFVCVCTSRQGAEKLWSLRLILLTDTASGHITPVQFILYASTVQLL